MVDTVVAVVVGRGNIAVVVAAEKGNSRNHCALAACSKSQAVVITGTAIAATHAAAAVASTELAAVKGLT
jgi:hypothetical protein